MITMYHDFERRFQGEPTASTWVARRIQDYIPLRQHLRRALDDPDHLYTVYVQHRVLAEWLRDLQVYPLYLLRWEEQLPDIPLPIDVSRATEATAESIGIGQDLPKGQLSQPTVLPPLVMLEGYLMSDRPTAGKIIVTNPNAVPFSTVKLQIDCMQSIIEWNELQANTSQLTEIQLFTPKTKDIKRVLVWSLTCECEGRNWQFEDYIELPVRQFQTNEIDVMFEELL